MADAAVEIVGLRKTFAGAAAVDGVDLSVLPGEFVTLLGPSGCGKTTTLNLIAGFLQPDAGSIRLAGKLVDDLPPFRRDIGLVFQDYALFPHMRVAENVAFGLRMRRVERQEIRRRVDEALALVQLQGLGGRQAGGSFRGGQRQRVALARALVIRPAVLLLDEPLSNLDLKLREEMRLEISALQHRLAITTILVTHDQGEALAVSDRIAVMHRGRIEQFGRPSEIYERPMSRFVAEFIGTTNFVPGETLAATQPGAACPVATGYGNVLCLSSGAIGARERVLVAVRPERMRVSEDLPRDGDLAIDAAVEQLVYLGNKTELHVRTRSGELHVLEQANDGLHRSYAAGDAVRVVASAADLCVFPERSQA